MTCALADHVSLMLGSGGEHVKRQPVRPGHVGNDQIEVHRRGDEGEAALKRSSLASSKVALRLSARAIAAASCGRLRLPLSIDELRDLLAVVAEEIALHP